MKKKETRVESRYANLGDLHGLLLRACPIDDERGCASICILAKALGVIPPTLYAAIRNNRLSPYLAKSVVDISEGRVTKAEIIDYVLNVDSYENKRKK